MKRLASACILICTVALFSIESEAYANEQCHPNFDACTAACSSTCAGKAFKCKIDVNNCNDQAAVLINTCAADRAESNSCSKVCGMVNGLLGLQDILFADVPPAAISTIPGSYNSFLLF
jgi:hypothetical protein